MCTICYSSIAHELEVTHDRPHPVEVTNLDRYGSAALPWSRPHDLLAASSASTELPSSWERCGRTVAPMPPGLAPSGTTATSISSGPATRKSRNLAANPACTISVRLEGIDLIFEGEAFRVTDQPTLEAVARLYREGGWPAEVEGDAFTAPYSAPSAGPPPWHALPLHLPHRLRRRHRRAVRCDPLALRALMAGLFLHQYGCRGVLPHLIFTQGSR